MAMIRTSPRRVFRPHPLEGLPGELEQGGLGVQGKSPISSRKRVRFGNSNLPSLRRPHP